MKKNIGNEYDSQIGTSLRNSTLSFGGLAIIFQFKGTGFYLALTLYAITVISYLLYFLKKIYKE